MKTSFRALAWSHDAICDEVLALSSPRWLILKDVPPFLWKFLAQLLAPFGSIISIDETSRSVSNLDARVLVSLKPGVDIPQKITLKINGDVFSCPVEMLGGLNACFLCKKEGHIRKNCPIINKRNTEISQGNIPSDSNYRELAIVPSTSAPKQSPDQSLGKSSNENNIANPLVNQPKAIQPQVIMNQKDSLKDSEGFQTVKNKKPRKKNAQQLALDQI